MPYAKAIPRDCPYPCCKGYPRWLPWVLTKIIKTGDYRRMVGRAFPGARLQIYSHLAALLYQTIRNPDMVNSQAHIAPEGRLPVIPPGISYFLRIEPPETILQTPFADLRQRLSFRDTEQHFAFPDRRVMHV